ncbi:DUF3826 domain-containing protein [Formosa sp. A9]|uniref:DUF3826 domain-containing protein n=1 Tax=Formosa sp. A9 TaxID=3442641 RepID=UPI003EB808BD
MIVKTRLLAVIILILTQQFVMAQAVDPEYVKVTNDRAQKIVDGLDLNNAEQELVVRDLIANQYRNLNTIHESRDAEIETVKASSKSNEVQEKEIEKIKSKADKDIDKLHKKYVNNLSKTLNDDQVNAVKDGMTYGVLPKTYAAFLEMIPSLKDDEKKYIYSNLEEAREHAMDGGSSHEKHWWFGKYKGRINNYLSARGYDLQKERDDWYKRIEAEKNKTN